MARREKKIAERGLDDCEGLARRYRLRRGRDSVEPPTRREALADEYREALEAIAARAAEERARRELADERVRRDFAPTLARALRRLERSARSPVPARLDE